jgi:hypothetical protein
MWRGCRGIEPDPDHLVVNFDLKTLLRHLVQRDALCLMRFQGYTPDLRVAIHRTSNVVSNESALCGHTCIVVHLEVCQIFAFSGLLPGWRSLIQNESKRRLGIRSTRFHPILWACTRSFTLTSEPTRSRSLSISFLDDPFTLKRKTETRDGTSIQTWRDLPPFSAHR